MRKFCGKFFFFFYFFFAVLCTLPEQQLFSFDCLFVCGNHYFRFSAQSFTIMAGERVENKGGGGHEG